VGFPPPPPTPRAGGPPAPPPTPPPLAPRHLAIAPAVTRTPPSPEQHPPAATRTPQRIMPRTGQHAITVGLPRRNAICPLDQPTQRHHQHGEQPLHLLGLARGMETIIADAVKPFW